MNDTFERRQSFQTIAWFKDLHRRQLLNLDPPYQRRSVWNQSYRNFFVETILLRYPAPAIFVHEDISADGRATYSVVDGKQRLTTIFDFTDDLFPVAEDSVLSRFAGLNFSALPDDVKKTFWSYQFSVEYLPTTDESTLTNVFDRINRNVARLQRQELRHARFGGAFASAAERLNDLLVETFGFDVPRIAPSSRRQMKDVELVAQLLLLLENGPQSFSQDELDDAYGARDEAWVSETAVETDFRKIVAELQKLAQEPTWPSPPMRRLRNQADFYSLFGAYSNLLNDGKFPRTKTASTRLSKLMTEVVNEEARALNPRAETYYNATRSASNDLRQRVSRIEIVTAVLLGKS